VPNKYEIITREQLKKLPKPEWLIKKIIEAAEMSMIYGLPGSGKTFIALDMCLCIATGLPWMGQETQACSVLYTFGEGASGIEGRVAAWEEENDKPVGNKVHFLAITPKLNDKHEANELCSSIDMLDEKPSLIVIDTLSRAIAGSEENSAKEMSVVVEVCGVLQKRYGAAILLGHHSTKSGGTARGSSAIEGAANAMIYVNKNKNNTGVISCEKQKNQGQFEDIKFKLVTVGSEDEASCTVHRVKINSHHETSLDNSVYLKPNQGRVMAFMQKNPDVIFPAGEIENGAKVSDGSFYRTLKELGKAGLISKVDRGFYRLTDEGVTITIK